MEVEQCVSNKCVSTRDATDSHVRVRVQREQCTDTHKQCTFRISMPWFDAVLSTETKPIDYMISLGFNTFLPIDRSNMVFMHVNTFQSQHVISEGDLNSTFLPPFRSELNSQKRKLRLQPR